MENKSFLLMQCQQTYFLKYLKFEYKEKIPTQKTCKKD